MAFQRWKAYLPTANTIALQSIVFIRDARRASWMFETIDSAEILYPAALAISGTRVWAATGHAVQVPWFHISIRSGSEDGLVRIVFATTLAQVLQLKSDRGQQQALVVKLVSPPFLNGTSEWKMERLDAIWKAPDSDQCVYVVEGRRHYPEYGEKSFDSLLGYERIY